MANARGGGVARLRMARGLGERGERLDRTLLFLCRKSVFSLSGRRGVLDCRFTYVSTGAYRLFALLYFGGGIGARCVPVPLVCAYFRAHSGDVAGVARVCNRVFIARMDERGRRARIGGVFILIPHAVRLFFECVFGRGSNARGNEPRV